MGQPERVVITGPLHPPPPGPTLQPPAPGPGLAGGSRPGGRFLRERPDTWGRVILWNEFIRDEFNMAERVDAKEERIQESVFGRPMSLGETEEKIQEAEESVEITRADMDRVRSDRGAAVRLANILFEAVRSDGQVEDVTWDDIVEGIGTEEYLEAAFFVNGQSERDLGELWTFAIR